MSETSDTPEHQEDEAQGALPSWVPGEMDEDAAVDAAAEDGADEALELAADDADAAEDAADEAVEAAPEEGAPEEGALNDDALDSDPGDEAPGDEADIAAAPAAQGDPVTVVLADRLRTPEAEELAETLRDAVGAPELIFDAREVSDIGAAAVACIVATLNARADISPPAAILSPSPAFVDAFSDLGLFQDLMQMEFRQ